MVLLACNGTPTTPAALVWDALADATADAAAPAEASSPGDLPLGGGTDGLAPKADASPPACLPPELAAPPEPLLRDRATACPGAFAEAAVPVAGKNTGFTADGQSRTFYLAVPDPAEFPGPRPLLLAFHGTNGSGADVFAGTQPDDPFMTRGFIVVAPDGNSNGTIWPEWDAMAKPGESEGPTPDLALCDALVDCLAAHFPVDARRIYAAGHSAGGIMTNYLLQRRSHIFAGGIPASGVLELTTPDPPIPLEPMGVLVTWGGDNDAWGGLNDGVEVPEFNFVEQAALATALYASAPGVSTAWCHGEGLGHVWLSEIDDLLADFLLAHPKAPAGGAPPICPWKLADPHPTATITCGEGEVAFVPTVTVECPAAATVAACQGVCQLLGDCVVENATVAPILGPQLVTLGFGGPDLTECADCVATCESDVGQGKAADQAVLGCYAAELPTTQCTSGIEGVFPLVDLVNGCCESQTESALCTRFCEAILTNSAASQFFPACAPWQE